MPNAVRFDYTVLNRISDSLKEISGFLKEQKLIALWGQVTIRQYDIALVLQNSSHNLSGDNERQGNTFGMKLQSCGFAGVKYAKVGAKLKVRLALLATSVNEHIELFEHEAKQAHYIVETFEEVTGI